MRFRVFMQIGGSLYGFVQQTFPEQVLFFLTAQSYSYTLLMLPVISLVINP